MPNVHSHEAALFIMQVLVSAFLAVLFLQSGLDKVVDRKGNREYLNQHFARSPLSGTVGPMFLVVTILQSSAGPLNTAAFLLLLLTPHSLVSFLHPRIPG